MEEPGQWRSGVGGGLLYRTSSIKFMAGYGYGIDAIRSHGRGANSIGVWIQFDLERAKGTLFKPTQPGLWRGLEEIFSR